MRQGRLSPMSCEHLIHRLRFVVVSCSAINMNHRGILLSGFAALLCAAAALGQSASEPSSASAQYSAQARPAAASNYSGQAGEPVSYASVSELNGLLAQLESTSKDTQADLVKLRIEHWKTDNSSKKQALANVDSIQRNLQGALPEIISGLRAAPEDVPATFKLYRNLDALYDVLGNVVELTGAFGSKEEVQSLSNDLSSFESTRKQMAERIENLSTSKEAEIVRLRTDLKSARAAIPTTPPAKIVVDENEPAKKPAPAKKKPAAKPASTTPSTAKPAATKPSANQAQAPQNQQQQPQKPQ